MVRSSFRDVVSQGKKKASGENQSDKVFLKDLRFDSTSKADKKTLVIPHDENGAILYVQPYHAINAGVKPNGRGIINLPKRDGGTFTPYKFGCISHVTEVDEDVKADKKAAFDEGGVSCPLCDVYYAERRKFYALTEQEHPNFKDYDKSEQREWYQKYDNEIRTVHPSFEFDRNANQLKVTKDNKLVVAVVSADGEFELFIWTISDNRLKQINHAIAEGVDMGVVDEGKYTQLNDDVDDPIYDISGVEVLVTYPKSVNKAQAGRDAKINVVSDNKSLLAKHDGILDKINEEVAKLSTDIDSQVENDFTLKQRTQEEVMEVINVEYYNELMAEYPKREYVEGEGGKSTASQPKAKAEEVDESEEVDEGTLEDLFDN